MPPDELSLQSWHHTPGSGPRQYSIFAYPRKGIFQRLAEFHRVSGQTLPTIFSVFLDDMRIGEIQVDGGAEPIMPEDFLDGCQ